MKSGWPAALGLVALFCLLGAAFLPLTGPQYDETLFGQAIYAPGNCASSVATPWGTLALMLMTYLGALKAWVWYPIVALAGNGVVALRLPALLAAAGAAVMFFLALRRMAGVWAAVLGLALLVTDTNYLVSSVYDWGPVALQHALWCTLLYAGVRFSEDGRSLWVALGGACLGIALWDKAICMWLILGFGASLFVFYPRGLWRKRALAVGVLAFVLGALPFLYYNQRQRLITFRSTAGWVSSEYATKTKYLDMVLGGEGLFTYVTYPQAAPEPPGRPAWERWSSGLNEALGRPLQSLQRGLVMLVLLGLPLLWFTPGGRRIVFFAVGGGLSALLMFSTRDAGASVHHDILLWPLPQLLIALAAVEAARRFRRRAQRIATVAVVVAVATNLAVMNHLYARLQLRGPSVGWTDAVLPLAGELEQQGERNIFATEWGILQQLSYLRGGKVHVLWRSDGVLRDLNTPTSRELVLRSLINPQTLYVGHGQPYELNPGTAVLLDGIAGNLGLQKVLLKVIPDSRGRPIFEVFEYRRP